MSDTAIPFTQYKRPDGRQVPVTIHRSDEIAAKAHAIINAGYRFECEVLMDGTCSLTIHDPHEEDDVAIQTCENGPPVLDAVDRLITGFEVP